MRHIFKGIVVALPVSLAIWTMLLTGFFEIAHHHPRALVQIENDVRLAFDGRHQRQT